jgi:hypothetical protein
MAPHTIAILQEIARKLGNHKFQWVVFGDSYKDDLFSKLIPADDNI